MESSVSSRVLNGPRYETRPSDFTIIVKSLLTMMIIMPSSLYHWPNMACRGTSLVWLSLSEAAWADDWTLAELSLAA